MSEIAMWDAWSGPPMRRTVERVPRPQRRPRTSVQREKQAEIRALEERLADPGPGGSTESLASIFASDLCGFGSSGRIFDVETVLEALGGVAQCPTRPPISLEGIGTERVAPNVVLASYPCPCTCRIWLEAADDAELALVQARRPLADPVPPGNAGGRSICVLAVAIGQLKAGFEAGSSA